MDELKTDVTDDEWKRDLRSTIVTAMTGTAQERSKANIQIGRYYVCSAPATLFKYYPARIDRLDAIKANKMWYSAPSEFNDVFDCEIATNENEIFKSILSIYPNKKEIRPGSPTWLKIKNNAHQIAKSLNSDWKRFRRETGVSCLNEAVDSLLMWAHYASNHHGICVEYNLLDINKQLGFSPIPVIYSVDRACFCSISINQDSINRESSRVLIESVSSKSPEWSYEKEWRIIRDKSACGDKWDDVQKGALLDMIAPTSITLGCQAEEPFEKAVLAYCLDSKINLYKMEKDKALYRLNREPIKIFEE